MASGGYEWDDDEQYDGSDDSSSDDDDGVKCMDPFMVKNASSDEEGSPMGSPLGSIQSEDPNDEEGPELGSIQSESRPIDYGKYDEVADESRTKIRIENSLDHPTARLVKLLTILALREPHPAQKIDSLCIDEFRSSRELRTRKKLQEGLFIARVQDTVSVSNRLMARLQKCRAQFEPP